MIDATSSIGSGVFAEQTKGGQAMGKEAFLKLLVAQLQHQDPLEPQENSEFVAQLAQFSSLEQSMGINDRLDLLATQTRGLANTEAIGLVGKQVTVRGSTMPYSGSGSANVGFDLAGDAAETHVTIRDASGNVVRTLDVGARTAGKQSVAWDGLDDAGNRVPQGVYTVSVDAQTEAGDAVGVTQETQGLVEAVSFEQGYPVLQLDTGVEVPASDLIKVNEDPNGSSGAAK